MSRKSRLEEVRDRRRFVVDRPSDTSIPPRNDWAGARAAAEAARVETAQRLRHELGLSTTDGEIRKRAAEATETAARRAIRDAGEG